MVPIEVCGHVVIDPVSIWREYAKVYPRTLREYDLAGQDDPDVLTVTEAWRSRRIGSRLTHSECNAVVSLARRISWADVPADAHLVDADPTTPGGLFAKAADLYWSFTSPHIDGVGPAKVHKILHIKRPDFYPVLDRYVRRIYQPCAATWTKRLAHLEGIADTDSPPYWAAFRDDLIRNAKELARYKDELAEDEDEDVRNLAQLTAVRLQDIIAWWIAQHPASPNVR